MTNQQVATLVVYLAILHIILSSLAGADPNNHMIMNSMSLSNYYDQNESDQPIFRDHLQLPNEDEIFGFPQTQSQSSAVELAADSRYPDSDLSWEMKLPRDHFKRSSIIQKRSSGSGLRLTEITDDESHSIPTKAMLRILKSTFKRAEVATTLEELNNKLLLEKESTEIKKRTAEHFYSCGTTYEWENLGVDHYPRYIRTALCDNRGCRNGLFACNPRKYKVKVLKRFALSDSPVPQEPNDDLPHELRSDWRLATIEITHCCECSNTPQ